MIRNAFATRLASLASLVALSVGGLGALEAGAQGTVTLSGATGNSCTASSITIGSNGSLNVTCQTTNSPTPVCNISGPTAATVGQEFTLTASCNPAATSWTWTGASSTASQVSITPQATGTLTFTVTGTNANGAGNSSAAHSVTVNPVAPPPPGPPKNCVFSSNPATPAPNQAATISISCENSPNVFAWYQYEGSALNLPTQTSVGSQSVTFPTAGTYKWWVQAGNQLGGGDVFAASVTVSGGGGGCPTVPDLVGPQSSASLLNLRFDLRPGQTGTQSFPLPLDGFGAARITGTPATSSETPKSTIAEVWVSECPGVKPADLPAGCMMELWGSTGQSNFYVGNSPWSSCPLQSNKTYHVNIKHRVCQPSGGGINYCSNYLKVSGQ